MDQDAPDSADPPPASLSAMPDEVLQAVFALVERPCALSCASRDLLRISLDPVVRASWIRRTAGRVFAGHRSAEGNAVPVPHAFFWAVGFYSHPVPGNGEEDGPASPTAPQANLASVYRRTPALLALQKTAGAVMNSEVARILLLVPLPKHLSADADPGRIQVIPRYQVQRASHYLLDVADRSDLLQVLITYGHTVYGERHLELRSDDVPDFNAALRDSDEERVRELVQRYGVLVGNDSLAVSGMWGLSEPLLATAGQHDPFLGPRAAESHNRLALIRYIARHAPPKVSSRFLEQLLMVDGNQYLLAALCIRAPRIAMDPSFEDGRLLVEAASWGSPELLNYILELSRTLTLDDEFEPLPESRRATAISLREGPPRLVRSWNRDLYEDIGPVPAAARSRALDIVRAEAAGTGVGAAIAAGMTEALSRDLGS